MKEGQEDELGGSSLNSSSRLPNIYSNTRPFPAQAPTVDTGYVRFENLVRNLKNELLQTKNKADVDLYVSQGASSPAAAVSCLCPLQHVHKVNEKLLWEV